MSKQGKTLAELDVKPGDVVEVIGGNRWEIVAIDKQGFRIDDPVAPYLSKTLPFRIVSRAAQPADPVKLDDAVPTPIALMAAAREQRRFAAAAAVAALPEAVADYGEPSLGNGSKQRLNHGTPVLPYSTKAIGTREEIIARQAVRYADALLAALEARHD